MKDTTSLTATQKEQLKAILEQVLKDCIGQATNNYFTSNNDKFNFQVNANSPYPAFYNTSDDVIVIQNPITLSPAALQEEFFHAYQNKTMQGGTGQYAGKLGAANIEFEAKVLRDISLNFDLNNGTSSGGGFAVNDQNYITWLGQITNNFTQYPTSFTPSQLNQYFGFMTEFVQQNPGYLNNQIDNALNPTAMFRLISSSPCNN